MRLLRRSTPGNDGIGSVRMTERKIIEITKKFLEIMGGAG